MSVLTWIFGPLKLQTNLILLWLLASGLLKFLTLDLPVCSIQYSTFINNNNTVYFYLHMQARYTKQSRFGESDSHSARQNFSLCLEPESSLTSSWQSAVGPCPDANEFIPHPHTQLFIVSILILPYHLLPDIQHGILPSAFLCIYFLCLIPILHLTRFCQRNIF